MRKIVDFHKQYFWVREACWRKVFIGAEVCVIKELKAILEKIFIRAEICVIKELEIVFTSLPNL